MTIASPLPRAARTAFDEHRRLRTLLLQIESAFAAGQPRAGSGLDVVAARLDTLRGPLRAHFDEEERAGLFAGIEDLAPEQAPVCARLLREHATLLGRLDALRHASPEDRRRPAWGTDVRAFLADLEGHEARETDLLNRALDGEGGAAD